MITGVNHITFSVSDLDKSFKFYTDVLNCKPVAKWKKGAYLLAGNLWLCLSFDEKTRKAALPEYTHIALNVSVDDWEKCSRQIFDGATIWKQNTSEGDSLYFLDPDGHKLEIHASDLQARIEAIKKQPYEDMKFFDLDAIALSKIRNDMLPTAF